MLKTTIKKISKNEYEVTEIKEVQEINHINIIGLQDEILELEEKSEKIKTELLRKKELFEKLKKVK